MYPSSPWILRVVVFVLLAAVAAFGGSTGS
jgi:hypothetical protein